MAGIAHARLDRLDFPRPGAHARVLAGQVEAGRRMALRDGLRILADAQIQRIQYVVARLDLRDEVPAHFLQIRFDHVPRARQRVVDPLQEGGLPVLDRLARVLDIAAFPLPGDQGVSLEDLIEGQGRAARAAGFLPIRHEQGRPDWRPFFLLKIAVDLARHDRLQGIERPQCRHAMPDEFGAAGQRQQAETQIADGLERFVAQLRLAAQRRHPVQRMPAQRAQGRQHPQVGERLEQHADMAGARALDAFGVQLEVDGEALEDAAGLLEILAFILDQARERVADLRHVHDVERSPWLVGVPRKGGQLPERSHDFRLARPFRQRTQGARQRLRIERRLQLGVRDEPAGEFEGRQPRPVFARPLGEREQGIAHALRIGAVPQLRFRGNAFGQLQGCLPGPGFIGPLAQRDQRIGEAARVQGRPSAGGSRHQVRGHPLRRKRGPLLTGPSAQRAQCIDRLLQIHGLRQLRLGRYAIGQQQGALPCHVLLRPLAQCVQHIGDTLCFQRLPQAGLGHEAFGQQQRRPAGLFLVGPLAQCAQGIGDMLGNHLAAQSRFHFEPLGQLQHHPLRHLGCWPLAERVQRVGDVLGHHGRTQPGFRRDALGEQRCRLPDRVVVRPLAQRIQRAGDLLRFQRAPQFRIRDKTLRQQACRPGRPLVAGPFAQRIEHVGDGLRVDLFQQAGGGYHAVGQQQGRFLGPAFTGHLAQSVQPVGRERRVKLLAQLRLRRQAVGQ